jgi:hypothetical protein
MRPTQFALGLVDVEHKYKKLKKMTAKQRKAYLVGRPIQVVLGPNKIYYIIDHHHLARACWQVGLQKVPVKIVQDFSKSKYFWGQMKFQNYVYAYDQFGFEQPFAFLPRDVRGLADDPYRSLAWSVREAGGFNKVLVPFAEFKWAQYFRNHININDIRDNYNKAVKHALKLCKTKGPKSLPGYKK